MRATSRGGMSFQLASHLQARYDGQWFGIQSFVCEYTGLSDHTWLSRWNVVVAIGIRASLCVLDELRSFGIDTGM